MSGIKSSTHKKKNEVKGKMAKGKNEGKRNKNF